MLPSVRLSLIALLALTSCTKEEAAPAAQDPKLPIVVYYTLPG